MTTGSNLGRFHKPRRRSANGSRKNGGYDTSPRIAVGFEDADWKRLQDVAKRQNLGVSALVRKAALIYLTHHG